MYRINNDALHADFGYRDHSLLLGYCCPHMSKISNFDCKCSGIVASCEDAICIGRDIWRRFDCSKQDCFKHPYLLQQNLLLELYEHINFLFSLRRIKYIIIIQTFLTQYSIQSSSSTDYVAGGELFTHLYQREHFNEDEVRIYIAEIILALEQLHKVRIFYLKASDQLICGCIVLLVFFEQGVPGSITVGQIFGWRI